MRQPERRRSPLSAILGVLLLIALLALGWFVWQWLQEGDRADQLNNEVTQLRRDAANVIAPDNNAPENDATAPADDDDDADDVIEAATDYERAQPANQGVEQQFEVAKREGEFARVNVNSNTGGHSLILKKVDDDWVVVLSGQQFEDADLQRFGVPASLVQ